MAALFSMCCLSGLGFISKLVTQQNANTSVLRKGHQRCKNDQTIPNQQFEDNEKRKHQRNHHNHLREPFKREPTAKWLQYVTSSNILQIYIYTLYIYIHYIYIYIIYIYTLYIYNIYIYIHIIYIYIHYIYI